MSSKFAVLLTLLLPLASWASSAFSHSLLCSSGGALKKYSHSSTEDSLAIQSDKITLKNPVDSYYSNRSGDFSVSKIKSIVESALTNNTDPYYALSLVMIESADTLKNQSQTPGILNFYETLYGTIPLDAIAMYDAFGCPMQEIPMADRVGNRAAGYLLKDFSGNSELYKKLVSLGAGDPKLSREERRSLSEQKFQIQTEMLENAIAEIPVEKQTVGNLNYRKYSAAHMICREGSPRKEKGPHVSECRSLALPQAKQRMIKMGDGPAEEVCLPVILEGAGGPPKLNVTKNDPKYPNVENVYFRGCCASARFPGEMAAKEKLLSLKNHLGFEFMKSKLEAGKTVGQNLGIQSPAEKMALALQAYNGFGAIGGVVGEQANKCLNGLNLKKSPVYGAGTADLALNVFMRDSNIRQIVQEASRKTKKEVPSVFCDVLGEGSFKFEGDSFAAIQEKHFAGRACPRHSYTYKTSTPDQAPPAPAGGPKKSAK